MLLASSIALASSGCGASRAGRPEHGGAPPDRGVLAAVSIPLAPALNELPRRRIASGIANPRGMHMLKDGSLLVSAAGTGELERPNTGSLLHLTDVNADGDFDDDGERASLLADQPSKNILEIVRRDEVFGMAGMAEGAGSVLVALAFFGGPSTIVRVEGNEVKPWTVTHGNINDIAFDPARAAWYAVSSTTDELVRLRQGEGSERVVKFPTLASGQDPVPGYLRSDPLSGDLLVSLFSGSPEGEEGGEGIELVARAASVVRVKPETRQITPAITELTVPTDLEATPDGVIYVLEFCDAFLDPLKNREEMAAGPSHGGFRRYSGRLLRVDRKSRQVSVIARGLDAPTNLLLAGGALYVAQGMGTPGRPIPGPNGQPQPLTGFIERIALPVGP